MPHADWQAHWEGTDLRKYAESAARHAYDTSRKGRESDASTGPEKATIRRFETILTAYVARIRDHGLRGATEAVAEEYSQWGVTPQIVNVATRTWRDAHKVPTLRARVQQRDGSRQRARVAEMIVLRDAVRELAESLGETKISERLDGLFEKRDDPPAAATQQPLELARADGA